MRRRPCPVFLAGLIWNFSVRVEVRVSVRVRVWVLGFGTHQLVVVVPQRVVAQVRPERQQRAVPHDARAPVPGVRVPDVARAAVPAAAPTTSYLKD